MALMGSIISVAHSSGEKIPTSRGGTCVSNCKGRPCRHPAYTDAGKYSSMGMMVVVSVSRAAGGGLVMMMNDDDE